MQITDGSLEDGRAYTVHLQPEETCEITMSFGGQTEKYFFKWNHEKRGFECDDPFGPEVVQSIPSPFIKLVY